MSERAQPRIHTTTNQLNESGLAPEFFKQSAAGASVGGASFRARDEMRFLPSTWQMLLPDTTQDFSAVTIEPYQGFNESGQLASLAKELQTNFVLANTPQACKGVLTYEMIQEQLLADSQFMEKIETLMGTSADVQVNSHHFYITRPIIEATRNGGKAHHIDIQRFHSLLSLASKRLFMDQNHASPKEGDAFLDRIGITQARIAAEIQALQTGLSIYSTQWERDHTVKSYHSVKTPDGHTLHESDLYERSMVVPLSYDPNIYAPDQTNSRKNTQRRTWFEKWSIPMDAQFISCVGRKDPERGYQKGLDIAMQYLLEGSKNGSVDDLWYFGFIGGIPTKSESMMRAYQQATKKLTEFKIDHPNLAQHVLLIDRVDHPFISHVADVEIQLPDTESWGLHTLQAMACGIPVITSNLPTYREWAGDGVIPVNPNDPSSVINVLKTLQNPKARMYYGSLAHESACRYTHAKSLSIMLSQILAKTNMVHLMQNRGNDQ